MTVSKCQDSPPPNKTTMMLLQMALGVIVAISAWATTTVVREVNDLRATVAAIQVSQATLMTNADGLAIWTEIARIQKELAGKANVADVPTPEVLRRFEKNERQIEDLQNALRLQEKR